MARSISLDLTLENELTRFVPVNEAEWIELVEHYCPGQMRDWGEVSWRELTGLQQTFFLYEIMKVVIQEWVADRYAMQFRAALIWHRIHGEYWKA